MVHDVQNAISFLNAYRVSEHHREQDQENLSGTDHNFSQRQSNPSTPTKGNATQRQRPTEGTRTVVWVPLCTHTVR